MLDSIRLPVSAFLLIATLLFGMVGSYQAALKGTMGARVFAAAAPGTPAPLKTDRFQIGEIIAPTADEEQHYVKMTIELKYQGDIENLIQTRRFEIQEKISQTIARKNFLHTKEDFADGFLQSDLLKAINTVIGRSEDNARVTKVTIAGFLSQ